MDRIAPVSICYLGVMILAASIVTLLPVKSSADESRLVLRPAAQQHTADVDHLFSPISSDSDSRPSSSGHYQRRNPLTTVVSSLAIVLGGFALFVVYFRKQVKAPSSSVMETLGTVQVAPKVHLHLVRLGERLLLLHLTSERVERVAEIADRNEVQSLLAAHYGSVEFGNRNVGNVLQDVDSADSAPKRWDMRT